MEKLKEIKYKTATVELSLKIDYERGTVWLTQEQMVQVLESSKSNISEHIKKVLSENLLVQSSVVRKFRTTATDGKTYNIKHYSLELVILVGNRIDIKKTTEFKEYVINIINEYKKANKKYEIVKFIDNSVENRVEIDVNVDPSEETVWLTLENMSSLFERDRSVILKHINNIYKNNELDKKTTCAKIAHMGSNSNRTYEYKIYNLDVVLAVGYRVNSKRGIMFRKWATSILKDYLIKGFVIDEKRVTVTSDNFNELVTKVNNIQTNQINIVNDVNEIKQEFNNRVSVIESKLTEYELPLQKIILDDEYYDSYTLIQSIFESANSEIIIIDSYIDRTILDRLVVKKSGVNVKIYTDFNKSQMLSSDINAFNKQYGSLQVIDKKIVHDRFIIIDQNLLYNLGHSVKDLGKKLSTIHKLDKSFITFILNNI